MPYDTWSIEEIRNATISHGNLRTQARTVSPVRSSRVVYNEPNTQSRVVYNEPNTQSRVVYNEPSVQYVERPRSPRVQYVTQEQPRVASYVEERPTYAQPTYVVETPTYVDRPPAVTQSANTAYPRPRRVMYESNPSMIHDAVSTRNTPGMMDRMYQAERMQRVVREPSPQVIVREASPPRVQRVIEEPVGRIIERPQYVESRPAGRVIERPTERVILNSSGLQSSRVVYEDRQPAYTSVCAAQKLQLTPLQRVVSEVPVSRERLVYENGSSYITR